MSDMIELPLDDDERAVEPPFLDWLHREPSLAAYMVGFVTDDDNGGATELTVLIHIETDDGRAISACLDALAQLLDDGQVLDKISHTGRDNFTFHFHDGEVVELADDKRVTQQTSLRATDLLKRIAQQADVAFRANAKLAS